MPKKNVTIVGAGPAGLFAAYKLCQNDNLHVTVIDKGRELNKRICPMRDGKPCAHCKPCNIMNGFGGAGTFSDCKLSLSPYGVGGDSVDYLGDKAAEYAKEVDEILASFDEDRDSRVIVGEENSVLTEIANKLHSVGLNLTYNPTKHLGTDGTYKVMEKLYNYLESKGVQFIFNHDVEEISVPNPNKKVATCKGGLTCLTDYMILAPGRSGNHWLSEQMNNLGIDVGSKYFDIGFRVEVPYNIISELTDNLYDMKISCNYVDGIKVRTFCTNPKGYVSEEHYNFNGQDVALANGHSYADKKSSNTNFAVLVSIPASSEIGRKIICNYNSHSGSQVVCGNFNQFLDAVNSNLQRTENGKTELTLNARTDIKVTDCVPDFISQYFVDFMLLLNRIYPGVASSTTNVYGLEAKFYSDTIKVDNNFETAIPGIYCIGDGSGITRGIIQSSLNGIAVANHINSITT